MKKRVMVSTVYSGNAVKYAITKLSPDTVIFVVENNFKELEDEDAKIKKKAIEDIKKFFGEIIKTEILQTKSLYDIYEITKDIVKKIDSISEEYDIIMHISEGRKPLSFGLTFAAYLRKNRVGGVYYVVSGSNEIIKFPSFSFPVNEMEKKLLEEINSGKVDIESLINELDRSRSVVYQYVKNLEENGYLIKEENKLKLTELGKIIIL